MQKKLNKIVNRTNNYLYKYFSKQKKTELTKPMLYGLLPGGKKVRSKILFDVGSIFEVDKKNKKQIIDMQIKKTGKLFSFCCVAPIIMSGKTKYLNKFNKIGNEIGLLFQIADDLIDLRGKTSSAGKKTKKDLKMGKATLISLLGTNNTIKYADNLKLKIFKSLKIFGKKGDDFRETINYILNRTK